MKSLLILGVLFFKKYVMNFALYENQKVSAEEYKKSDNLDLRCPCCNSQVVAKQGEINIWHFAHKVKNRCSEWFKPMTEWHSNWQKCFPNECREVIHKCEKTGKKHIADIKTNSGIVIEFQHSSISSKEIKAREEFYGEKMIWVLDGNNYKVELGHSNKYQHKFSIDYMIEKNKSVIEKFKNQLSVPFGCHEDFIYDYLKKGMEFYRYSEQMIKIYTNIKFFKIAKRHIFIDFGNYLLLVKDKENNKKAVKHKDYIFSKNDDYSRRFNNTIYENYYDYYNECDNYEFSHCENLYGLDIISIKSILCNMVSKQKFLEKYATHEITANLQTQSLS